MLYRNCSHSLMAISSRELGAKPPLSCFVTVTVRFAMNSILVDGQVFIKHQTTTDKKA